LKKVKLISKIIVIMILYIFVFFRDFLGNSIGVLLVRTYYGTVNLIMVDYGQNQLSTTTIISSDANFFITNDVSFSDLQQVYHCINNQFDPVYNPSYSLINYVQSPSFLGLLMAGWLVSIVICVTKAVSIWKGGISNRPSKNTGKYFFIYGFY
jgi:disulfide bond formation protein DsbB